MNEDIINKTMDREDLDKKECKRFINELENLMRILQERGLKYASWLGTFDYSHVKEDRSNRGPNYNPYPNAIDDKKIPWYSYWMISWLYLHSGVNKNSIVVDLGGGSSLLSFFLAYKGCRVYAVDINDTLAKNGDLVSKEMGWNLICVKQDVTKLELDSEYFDAVFFSNLITQSNINIKQRKKIMRSISNILKSRGRACIEFDYLNPNKRKKNTIQDIYSQFVLPSKLKVVGNEQFFDNGKRYLVHPWFYNYKDRIRAFLTGRLSFKDVFRNDMGAYTFGTLFLEKT